MFKLNNKVALVTGARQGMGAAHAKILASQGAKVVVTDIDEKECSAVVEEIESNGGQALCFKMDVTDSDNINQVVSAVVDEWGKLDILVNNAGVYAPKEFLEMTEDEWDKMIEINLKGQFLCAQRCAKEMKKSGWGRIINISSVASGQVGVGIAGGSHYSATKGGIIAFTESLAIELAEYGINVNAVAPGAIETPMLDDAGMDEKSLQGLLQAVPLGRVGKSEEVSSAVAFLASEEASYITGSTVYVDGGWLAS